MGDEGFRVDDLIRRMTIGSLSCGVTSLLPSPTCPPHVCAALVNQGRPPSLFCVQDAMLLVDETF